MTTIVTLALAPASQTHFEALRQQHYPAALNRIPAHLSLFHQLPGSAEIEQALAAAAGATLQFAVEVTGVRSLGRGVAYTLSAPELLQVHRGLSGHFEPYLTAQDRQRFSPHIVVQNKAAPADAKELLAALQASFTPHTVQATGLLWWEYLGGPWRLLETFAFAS